MVEQRKFTVTKANWRAIYNVHLQDEIHEIREAKAIICNMPFPGQCLRQKAKQLRNQ